VKKHEFVPSHPLFIFRVNNGAKGCRIEECPAGAALEGGRKGKDFKIISL
jgi:hypothetical protein